MKFIALFALISCAYAAVTVPQIALYDTCTFDGYYQCQNPVIYNWEEPNVATATFYDLTQTYSVLVTPPFPITPYGADNQPTFSIDSNMALISYNADNTKAWAIACMYPGYAYNAPNLKVYYEVKGTAPNRKIVITWKNNKNYQNDDITTQVKIFENGNFEFHTQNYVKTSSDYILHGIEFVDFNGANWVDFFIYNPIPKNYSQTATGLYVSAAPVTAQCGNGIVETGEDCDGNVCCSSSCKFLTGTTVCRPSQGGCDVAEVCSGTASTCPADAFAPATTACPEDFGVCDVRTARKCSGTSALCSGFAIPSINGSQVHWLAYSVISFTDFTATTGSVGGRLAVRRDVTAGQFSVGHEIKYSVVNTNPTTPIVPATFSFIAGGNVNWNNGEIYPTTYSALREERGYAGGSFTGAAGLQQRFASLNAGNLDSDFTAAQNHYIAISNNLAAETPNVQVSAFWSGLHFTCNDQSKRYVVNIDASMFDGATWYSVDDATCPFGSAWIFNIQGNGAMNFHGGDFPGVGERIVFNILGSGRTVNIKSRVNGNLLAPAHTVNQDGGVSAALVIANNIPKWSSSTNPSCADLQPFTVILKVVQLSLKSSTEVNLASLSIVHAGDNVQFNTKSYKVVERKSTNGQVSIVLDRGLEEDIPVGSSLTVTVDPNQPRGTDTVTTQNSSAVTLIASAAFLIFAMLF